MIRNYTSIYIQRNDVQLNRKGDTYLTDLIASRALIAVLCDEDDDDDDDDDDEDDDDGLLLLLLLFLLLPVDAACSVGLS